MTVVLFRTVKVTMPSPTVPAGLVTVAVSGTKWSVVLNVVVKSAAVVVVAAGLTVRVCMLSLDVLKSGPPS